MPLLDELTPFVPLISLAVAFSVAIVPGLKFAYKLYNRALDNRINKCIHLLTKPFSSTIQNQETRIKSLEDRFQDLKEYFYRGRPI